MAQAIVHCMSAPIPLKAIEHDNKIDIDSTTPNHQIDIDSTTPNHQGTPTGRTLKDELKKLTFWERIKISLNVVMFKECDLLQVIVDGQIEQLKEEHAREIKDLRKQLDDQNGEIKKNRDTILDLTRMVRELQQSVNINQQSKM